MAMEATAKDLSDHSSHNEWKNFSLHPKHKRDEDGSNSFSLSLGFTVFGAAVVGFNLEKVLNSIRRAQTDSEKDRLIESVLEKIKGDPSYLSGFLREVSKRPEVYGEKSSKKSSS